ncbi:hypothetical protein EJ04DRAFT_578994 [Polyplosphaeria fusca]|uniref:Uncharacterized protein n=1 Tax=Polyplosphaeria fusca TaxID=682080 RepID=A0A9P4QVB3_9PLEO|nr:hypothetical protein EJ04DRAFT_578994 [Polyplosphaeria fusca]
MSSSRNLYRGPLITSFTSPPPSCNTLAVPDPDNKASTGYWGQTCLGSRADQRKNFDWNTECYPWYSTYFAGGFFSPASRCPDGWQGVVTRTVASGASDAAFESGEVAIDCCPGGMTIQSNTCGPMTTGTPTFVAQRCGATSSSAHLETWAYDNKSTIIIAADALQLRYKEPGSSKSIVIRNGAIIGTVVGGCIVLAAIAIFFLLRQRKKHRSNKQLQVTASPNFIHAVRPEPRI